MCFYSESLLFLLEFGKVKYFILHYENDVFDVRNEKQMEGREILVRMQDLIHFDDDTLNDVITIDDDDYEYNNRLDVNNNRNDGKRSITSFAAFNTIDVNDIQSYIIRLWLDLYYQYISSMSMTTINISHACKKQIGQCLIVHHLIDKNGKRMHAGVYHNVFSQECFCEMIVDIMQVFNVAEQELYMLLSRDSFRRFKGNADF